ncbi:hypothetical protein V5799_027177 [Amblyomma americanum]|uniref:Uncharacterized protein n=1 Tax=Amblyomma americanum TaxID=6943 RepID=A0AAQ4DGG6_AMBAM
MLLSYRPKGRLDLLLQKPQEPNVERHTLTKGKWVRGQTVLFRNFGLGQRWMKGTVQHVLGNRMLKLNTAGGPVTRHFDQVRRCDNGSPTEQSEWVQQQQSERGGEADGSPTSRQDDGPLSATSSSGPLLIQELVGSPSTSSSSPTSRPGSPRLRGAGALLSVSLETLVAPKVPVRRRRAKSLGDLSQLRPPWEPRRVQLAPSGALDDVCLQGLSREQLLRRWRDSERRLLNLLREAVREKQALERKLAFLHNALRKKPP